MRTKVKLSYDRNLQQIQKILSKVSLSLSFNPVKLLFVVSAGSAIHIFAINFNK